MKKVLFLPIFLTILFILNSNAYSRVNFVTVQPGASLSQIANAHNTTVASIMHLNRLRNYVIFPGEKLKVPSGNNNSYHPAYHRTYGHYTVQFGDTLSLIAQKYGTSIAELRKLNRLYSNVIRQGAVLTVPASNAGGYSAPSQEVTYITVQPGASLSQIANAHNTTVASIMHLNRLRNYVIFPGEKLKVPSGNNNSYHPAYHRTYGHYTVQFGDTLSLIAQKYGTSIAELRKLNRLYSNVIRQGAVLTVPASNAGGYSAPSQEVTYITVQPGASLSQIANAHNTTVASIMHLNRLRNYVIFPGEKLKVPSGNNDKKYAYYSNNDRAKCINQSGKKTGNANNNFGLGKKIVNVAYRYKGVPYVWGGTNDTGMDCSGLVQRVFRKLGIHLPRTAAEQSRLGTYVPKDKLKPGDLLFFRTYASYISHVGIYIGHGKFIQENSGAGEVTITSLSDEYYKRTYAFAKAVK